jgi:uncharacterized protein
MLTAITAIVARFNAISEGLSAEPPRHAPIFRKTDDGLAVPHLWCMGFLAGMRLRIDDWRPLLDLNSVDHGLMLPILLYCVDPSGHPMVGPPREGPESEEFLRTAYQDIPIVVPRSGSSGCRNRCARRTVNADCHVSRTGYDTTS